MLDLGLIKSSGNGLFHLLPLYQKSLDKCVKLLDFHMARVSAQKLSIPLLTSSELWKKSGRLYTAESELFLTTDRHEKMHVLGPVSRFFLLVKAKPRKAQLTYFTKTYEEAITDLLASIAPVSYKQFPLRLYQVIRRDKLNYVNE